MKTTLKDLAAAKDKKQESSTPEALHRNKSFKELEHQIEALRTEIGARREFAAGCAAAIEAQPPFARVHLAKKGSAKRSKGVCAVLKLSDWHIGEVVNPKETEGFNEYNWAIAQDRVFSIVEAFVQWVESARTSHAIDDVYILGEGDYISGDIHYELQVTNEFPVTVQSVRAGLLLGEVVRRVAPHFRRVFLKLVGADNHGRLQKKPQAKMKTSNNYSYVVHAMAREYLSRLGDQVDIEEAEGAKLFTHVGGHPFLIEHGDTVRGWSGLPYYGFNRTIGKEATRRMGTDKGFRFWSIAHFHVPNIIDYRTLVNGSLSGTSEFDHLCGRHADPAQVAFLLHPVHGLFNWTAFHGKR